MSIIRIGIPKGNLQEATIRMFKRAGFNIFVSERSYKPSIDDEEIECMLIRAQEIPKYVEMGVLDAGFSGKDWIIETRADVEEVADLDYNKTGVGKIRLVIAVPQASAIKSVKDLEGKRIATELVNTTTDYLKRNKINAFVEFSWGATEVKTPELVDAISELTETGSSLRANNLRIVDTVLESTTRFIANKKAMNDKIKRQKIEQIAMLLNGALAAEGKVGLKMNLQRKDLDRVVEVLPALKKPTISDLSDKEWVALEVILDEQKVRTIIPELKRRGAQGIVEYSLNKIIE